MLNLMGQQLEMIRTDDSSLNFLQNLNIDRPGLPGASLPWLNALRQNSKDLFIDIGLPTQKMEGWKYTSLKPLEDAGFRPANEDDGLVSIEQVPPLLPELDEVPRLVFVNGRLQSSFPTQKGLPDGVYLDHLSNILNEMPGWAEKHLGKVADANGLPLVQLNTAMMDTGYVLRVGSGLVVEKPIEIIFIGGVTDNSIAYFPRNLIVLEDGAKATVVEHHTCIGSVGSYLSNMVTEITLGASSNLSHYKVQAESKDAIHLGSVQALVASDAKYDSFTLSIGGRLSRNEILVQLNGSGAYAGVSGGYLMRGNEHCDNTTTIEHLVPDTSSREVFKGVLDDQSRAVFQGRIVVHKDAQRTDGHQLCKTLLLSSGAEMDAKPELEIFADDVKCSHGATTGQIDESALFYLRSRGIPEAHARNLLVQSFLAEALEEIPQEDMKKAISNKILHWLPASCYLSEEWRET